MLLCNRYIQTLDIELSVDVKRRTDSIASIIGYYSTTSFCVKGVPAFVVYTQSVYEN